MPQTRLINNTLRGALALLCLATALMVCTGCSETPEEKLQRAFAAAAANNGPQAEQLLLQVLTEQPDNLRAHLALGEFYLRQGQWADSRQHYQYVARKRPFHAVAQLNLGLLALMDRDFEQASIHFASANQHAQQERAKAESAMLLNVVQRATRLRGTINDLRFKLEEQPDDTAILQDLLEQYQAYITLFAAVNLNDVALELETEKHAIAKQLADRRAAIAAQQPDAVTPALQLVASQTEVALGHQRLNESLRATQVKQQTLQQITALLQNEPLTGPQQARLHFLRGRLALLDEDLAGAIAALQQAIAADPDRASYHAALAELYFNDGRPATALVDALQQAVRLDPDYAYYRLLLGDVLASQGQVQDAREHYRQALVHARKASETARAQRALQLLDAGELPTLWERESSRSDSLGRYSHDGR